MHIAQFTGDIPQNVNFALKAEIARTFLDSRRIAYQTARSNRQLSPADVGDIVRPFTVQIGCKKQVGFQTSAVPAQLNPARGARGLATILGCTICSGFQFA